jgi:flagellar biosynthetic protein FlhB
MAEEQEKTEQATPRRRQKAREEGNIARSRELSSMFAMGGFLILITLMGGTTMRSLLQITRDGFIISPGDTPIDSLLRFMTGGMKVLLPIFAISLALGVFGNAIQGGIVFKPLKLDLARFNPVEGLKKIFSRHAIVEFLKGLLKFSAGALLLYYIIRKILPSLPQLMLMEPRTGSLEMMAFIIYTLKLGFLTFFLISILDYINEKWKLERSLRMTKEDIKEEFKETEGDPQIKSRVRSIQREMAQRRMIQEVPKATVVITNPTHYAVALKYRKGEEDAPRVVAKGVDFMAARIREAARKAGVPIVEDRALARALYPLEPGMQIPEHLYRAVAKILAYIYRLQGVAV